MAIYQGDVGIHDIKVGNIDVFEIYQGNKLVYPENIDVTITFKLNVSGTITFNSLRFIMFSTNNSSIISLNRNSKYKFSIIFTYNS